MQIPQTHNIVSTTLLTASVKKITNFFSAFLVLGSEKTGKISRFFSYFEVFFGISGLLDWWKPINFTENIVTS